MTIVWQSRDNVHTRDFATIEESDEELEDAVAEANRLNRQLGWRKYRIQRKVR